MTKRKGGFTLPGEAGYERLTLELAQKWGADVIRDSDGTALSKELLEAGYQVYSTVCVIREHNAWAKNHPACRQQTILCTPAIMQTEEELRIPLMDGFFHEQFELNDSADSRAHWQVYDRTSNTLVDASLWAYENGVVTLRGEPFHKYTVSFFAYRIWEEISMYNHITNNWQKEHLMQIDPIHEETMTYLIQWMIAWCESHRETNVVRFTSLFYNFVWIWGSDERNRHLFTDWSSYDFTVSPKAFALFEEKYGYAMTLEDFVNKGLRRSGHTVPDKRKRDWMGFINGVVLRASRKLVDIVHAYGKKAYVFYDDSWVGLEPNGERFSKFHFDGLIKCVFSGFEVRLCVNAPCETHEIRLHPYLFPVGLGGLPTFAEGGHPTDDAKAYWAHVRRALLRKPVDRIGLGGYLHLTEGYPDFVDYIARIADEFREIRDLHSGGAPVNLRPRVAVLSAYGEWRAWTLSGHFHETDRHDLIHVLESLSGLPFDVRFLKIADLDKGVLKDADVLILAGQANSAWSGGEEWASDGLVAAVSRFVYEGGAIVGVGEPAALKGYDTCLRLSHLFGVDIDDGRYDCHGKWQFLADDGGLVPPGAVIGAREDVRLTDGKAQVLAAPNGVPQITAHAFGKGKGVYLSAFRYGPQNTRLLQNLILFAAGESLKHDYVTSNPITECAYFADAGALLVINNKDEAQETAIDTQKGRITVMLEPMGVKVIKL